MPAIKIGLSGGIAAGKSTIRGLLLEASTSERRVEVIDCDKLGHQCYAPGSDCFRDVVTAFGDVIVADDGTINRRALGGIVFSDASQMKKLNDTVWPHLRRLVESTVAAADADGANVIVAEAAVLLQAGWDDMFHHVWGVQVPRDVAVVRLMSRNSFDRAEAEKRVDAQAWDESFERRCDAMLNNSGGGAEGLASLKRQVTQLLDKVCADEIVTHVDEHNNVLGSIPRSKVRGKNLWHRATYIFAKSSAGELYVQKRTDIKDYCPGYFDPVSGGVVAAGESYELGATREVEEEMGIRGVPLTHLFTFSFADDRSKVWGDAWECTWDGEITPQPSEVASVHKLTPLQIIERIKAGDKYTPDGTHALKLYMEHKGIDSGGFFESAGAAGAGSVASRVVSTVRRNPVPIVVGAGVAVAAVFLLARALRR